MSRRGILGVLLVGVLLVAIIADSVRLWTLAGTVGDNQHAAISALCTFRADLQARVTSSQDFLAKHPAGIPGIPPAVIRQGVVNEQRTVRSLHGLPCRKFPAKHPR